MSRIREALADLMGGLHDTTADGIIWKEFVNRLEGLTRLLQNPNDIADWLNARPELADQVMCKLWQMKKGAGRENDVVVPSTKPTNICPACGGELETFTERRLDGETYTECQKCGKRTTLKVGAGFARPTINNNDPGWFT